MAEVVETDDDSEASEELYLKPSKMRGGASVCVGRKGVHLYDVTCTCSQLSITNSAFTESIEL